MKKINKMAVGVVCALMLAMSVVPAASLLNGWTFTAGGVGTTPGKDINQEWVWGGELGLSKNLTLKLDTDLGLRQSFGYGTVGTEQVTKTEDAPPCCGGDSVTTTTTVDKDGMRYRTELFWDWNIPLYKKLSLFVGPTVGINYGTAISAVDVTVGPEAGLKYQLTKNLFTYTRANYDWNLSRSGKDDFRVSAGIGWSF